jgi:IS1 family transposase
MRILLLVLVIGSGSLQIWNKPIRAIQAPHQDKSCSSLIIRQIEIFDAAEEIHCEDARLGIFDSLPSDGKDEDLIDRKFLTRQQNKIMITARFRVGRRVGEFAFPLERLTTQRDFSDSGYSLSQIPYSRSYKPFSSHLLGKKGFVNSYPCPFNRNLGFDGISKNGRLKTHTLGLASYVVQSANGSEDATNPNQNKIDIWKVCRSNQTTEITFRIGGGSICLFWSFLFLCESIRAKRSSGRRIHLGLGVLSFIAGSSAFLFPPYYQCEYPYQDGEKHTNVQNAIHSPFLLFHANTVTQKLLTTQYYCNTIIASGRQHMANVLSTDKQIAVIGALAEGSSIRSIERITGVHRDTIMRLGVRAGKGCARLLDAKMRDLSCQHLQFDEIWGFIGKKERHCRPDDSLELGDVWTFCAIDSETKLVPSFKCGKRDLVTANAFVSDVASRVRNRVQISSDALSAYVQAIETNFGADVDFAQIVKTYITDDSRIPERRFSAPEIVVTEKKAVSGFPDLRKASTSHIERLNGTTRLHMRRLTRLTYAFSKKLENFEAAVALHFAPTTIS